MAYYEPPHQDLRCLQIQLKCAVTVVFYVSPSKVCFQVLNLLGLVWNTSFNFGGGRVVQWCWVNFQCRGVLLIWIIVGQGPNGLAVGVGGGCFDSFSLVCHFFLLSVSLWETARYRLKYCLKGPLSPKPTNQPNLLIL